MRHENGAKTKRHREEQAIEYRLKTLPMEQLAKSLLAWYENWYSRVPIALLESSAGVEARYLNTGFSLSLISKIFKLQL